MNICYKQSDQINFSLITDKKYHYSFGYFTANKWVDNSKIVLIRGESYELAEFNKTAQLVLVDIENGEEELLHTFNSSKSMEIGAGFGEGYVVFENTVYFIDNLPDSNENALYKFDIVSKTKKEIYRGINCYFPHITNDGRYVNIELLANENDDFSHCIVIDTLTERAEKVFSKKFNKPFVYPAHVMICPTDHNKIFFCHEGDTFYVSNRLWMYEKGKGMKCIARQRLDSDGNLGDCFGHECWTNDGNGLYFVKYDCSPVGPKGISYVNADGSGLKTAIYGKYLYWHVCVSADGRYLASDTLQDDFSGVCLIDTQTNSERMLYKANTMGQHPSHPHPSFSPDGEKLIFHSIEDGQLSVCIINLKEIGE